MIRRYIVKDALGQRAYLVDVADSASAYLPPAGHTMALADASDEAWGATRPGYAALAQPGDAN